MEIERISTAAAPCDTVEGYTNGDATERRSAYAKATADKYDPPSHLRASACALCAMADKSADRYEIGGEGVTSAEGSDSSKVEDFDLRTCGIS